MGMLKLVDVFHDLALPLCIPLACLVMCGGSTPARILVLPCGLDGGRAPCPQRDRDAGVGGPRPTLRTIPTGPLFYSEYPGWYLSWILGWSFFLFTLGFWGLMPRLALLLVGV